MDHYCFMKKTLLNYTHTYTHIYIFFLWFNCLHLGKGLCSKRREINRLIIRAMSIIAFLRCRPMYIYMCVYIHGVICMIVRHNENVLGSATNSDFMWVINHSVDWSQFTCDYMLLFQIVCLIIGMGFFRCVSIFDIFPLGINYIGLTVLENNKPRYNKEKTVKPM